MAALSPLRDDPQSEPAEFVEEHHGNRKMDLSPFCRRARAFLNQGRVDDALGLYGDVLQVDPDNVLALADRGTAYAMLKKFDPALRDLKRAFELGYVEAAAFCTVGTIHVELMQPAESLKYFDKAIEADASYPFIYYNRANALRAMNDDAAARADLETCLKLNPDEAMLQAILSRMQALRS